MIYLLRNIKMTHNSICNTLEKDGWTKETTFINEKTKYTGIYSSEPEETKLIIDICCPRDQKILIRGTKDGDIKKCKDAYSTRLTLMDSLKNEINQFAKIRITKERTTEGASASVRCFYWDISKSDDDHVYRPKENIFLQGKEHLFVYVIGEYIGRKPHGAIDKDYITFSIKADIFTLYKD